MIPGAAHAQEEAPDQAIAELREMLLYARYREVIDQSETLLGREDLTARQRNAVLESLAVAQLARRDTSSANQTLSRLFGRDPDHRLSNRDVGPEVQAAFDRARDGRPEQVTVTLTNETPTDLARRSAPIVNVRLGEGGDAVEELRLAYRQGDTGRFEQSVMSLDPDRTVARARIPVLPGEEAYEVEYYVEARAPSGAVVGTMGSGDEPLALTVPEAPEGGVAGSLIGSTEPGGGTEVDGGEGGGIAKQWWFWTIVGVAAVGLGVGGYLLLASGDDGRSGSLGSGVLP